MKVFKILKSLRADSYQVQLLSEMHAADESEGRLIR